MVTQQKGKGFSIIEVVLVLAIAGLIFLMVLIALPPLQRGQRDQARKNDASIVASAVNTLKSANRGGFGTDTNAQLTTKMRQYVDRLDQYEKDTAIVVQDRSSSPITPGIEQVIVTKQAKCPTTMPAPGSGITLVAGTSRQAAVSLRLENNGSSFQVHCVDV